MKTETRFWVYYAHTATQYYNGKRYAWDTMTEAISEAKKITEAWGDRMEVHAVVIREDGVILANDIVWMTDETYTEKAERMADSFFSGTT